MEKEIIEEIYRVVDEYFTEPELNKLIKVFVEEKNVERSTWSSITRSVHGMLGGDSPAIHRAAALTEVVMLALDMIDDLQDQDNWSKPWMSCPQAYTLNGILGFLITFMGELSTFNTGDSSQPALPAKEISRLLARAVHGQQLDINGSIQTEQDYILMVQQKSGSLIQLACYMGYALIEHLDQEQIDRLNELSYCIGIIAQIGNDVNDLQRYDVKNDLLQKKRTLPILFLLEDSPKEFPILTEYYEGRVSKEDFLLKKLDCLAYVKASGCLEYSQIIQALYKERAEKLLETIPDSLWKDQFVAVTIG
ncbi:polyprenyl synthetase family protein [Paenibacillus eucommiae]|uniref:Competence protein ComQ n=1 Tax=Paenibacillus eucommiae TaxID=1355755 RepID=A0ABS4J677_9BACL|nr:polyprenyl synthetase family protein [Paenibacillus eucommiae]MBP1995361.1 competence protein ComQ [Paenibacillus eucommiae]